MKTYQHSTAFEHLKATQEVISENLTSLHYLQTLDLFLWRALEPIHAECPSLFVNYLAKVTAKQTAKASMKFTSDDRHKLPVKLFNVATNPDLKKAHEEAKSMHINRGIYFGFLSLFLRHLKQYEDWHRPSLDVDPVVRRSVLHSIEVEFGIKPNSSLYAVIQQARYWYDKARWFKELIMQKYTRLALNHAQLTYRDYNHFIPLDDIVQIYLLTVSRAIDRCDARQGVLTTFITNWFKSARSEVGELANGYKDQSYESLNEEYGDAASDIFGSIDPDTSWETIEHIAYSAKKIDKHGYIRSTLGIPEYLSDNQIQILERFTCE